MTKDKLVVGLTGMPGSGKSLALNVATESSYDIVVMGNIVREEAKRRNLEPTPENIGRIMLELRQTEGSSVIAQRCLSKIENAKTRRVFVDGIRSLAEAEELKKHFPTFTLIAIHSSPETRFKRLNRRQRSDDPDDQRIFNERDNRELSVGLGNAIAMAEHMIINEEDPQTAKEMMREALKKVEEKWKKHQSR
jgi:dephospho-CoA kinase